MNSLNGVGGHHFLDLLDQKSVDAAAAKAVERFGRIDVLTNIAGGFRMGKPVHETADSDWNFLFDVNVRTALKGRDATSAWVCPAA